MRNKERLNFIYAEVDNRDGNTTELHIMGETLSVTREYLESIIKMTDVGHVIGGKNVEIVLEPEDIQYLLDNMTENNPDWKRTIKVLFIRAKEVRDVPWHALSGHNFFWPVWAFEGELVFVSKTIPREILESYSNWILVKVAQANTGWEDFAITVEDEDTHYIFELDHCILDVCEI